KLKLGGTPWPLDDLQNVLEGGIYNFGTFSLGPDGKLYNLGQSSHNVIEYPDLPGEASGYCLAADNPPSCLGVPFYLLSTPHPNYRLGPRPGSACDTIVSSTQPPLAGSPTGASGYGVTASPSVASNQVEVSITLPSYGSTSSAEVQVVDMLGRVLHRHRFPPYAYLHSLDVSGWPAGLYNVVLLEGDRPKAGARLVVAR
ncbi:MAG: T9SS type A sorting domain-containing protein, partial [Saprospiraceae bacterium]|nr:T9SS type A sorting domain-containing protein [Saprospiraceae bacterium]